MVSGSKNNQHRIPVGELENNEIPDNQNDIAHIPDNQNDEIPDNQTNDEIPDNQNNEIPPLRNDDILEQAKRAVEEPDASGCCRRRA